MEKEVLRKEVHDSVLEVMQEDITAQDTEAIVNAANRQLAPGGGVAGAIHRAAGPQLWAECKNLGGCQTGEAKITRGYNLKAPYVIHTVGPIYHGSPEDPRLLASSYLNSLKLAEEKGIKSISFPALSTGAFDYPMREAAKIAFETIIDFLKGATKVKLVRLVLFGEKDFAIHREVLGEFS